MIVMDSDMINVEDKADFFVEKKLCSRGGYSLHHILGEREDEEIVLSNAELIVVSVDGSS